MSNLKHEQCDHKLNFIRMLKNQGSDSSKHSVVFTVVLDRKARTVTLL